jgi:hypothetical protein
VHRRFVLHALLEQVSWLGMSLGSDKKFHSPDSLARAKISTQKFPLKERQKLSMLLEGNEPSYKS